MNYKVTMTFIPTGKVDTWIEKGFSSCREVKGIVITNLEDYIRETEAELDDKLLYNINDFEIKVEEVM